MSEGSAQYTGRVKWFNNKAGYGFITVSNNESSENNDIFVHHNGIIVSNDQYKYLVQGEYVVFNIQELTSGTHKCQAINVKGIDSGKLMCETRSQVTRNRYYKSDPSDNAVENNNFRQTPQYRNQYRNDSNWKLVRRSKKPRETTNNEIISV